MADFEDANSPTWRNCIEGQVNLTDAIERTIELDTGEKTYRLNDEIATLIVRPRGWHLDERNVPGGPMSASLFDFGLYLHRNAQRLLERGTGPYLYLPKLESHLEARLWNDVFDFTEDTLGLDRGTIKATVLIETILAAFEMEEILFELRDHIVGLNAGRWDYIFSIIKKFRTRPEFVLPDRAQVTMTVPFMRAYTELLVKTCHRRGAHAMGGMAAFVPSRRDAEVNERAFAKVAEDKEREAGAGFDGTWVAHPDLVPVALREFDLVLGGSPNQVERLREEVDVAVVDLLDVAVPGGEITEEGVAGNVSVGIRYLESWLRGVGRGGARQPDGGRGDRGDRAFPDLAVAAARAHRARARGHARGRRARRRGRGPLGRRARAVRPRRARRRLRGVPDLAGLRLSGGTSMKGFAEQVEALERRWAEERWAGIERPYTAEEVVRLRGSVQVEHTLARRGAERLWSLLHSEEYVAALGALSGGQAVQMVKAGLKAIYLSGWQVAADANLGENVYPDQSLYPATSAPALVRRLNNALRRADQIEWAEGNGEREWLAPIVADAEAGFGGALNAFELMKGFIEAGASGRALRGSARVREEVRAPRRQGSGPDGAVRADARRRAAGRGRARRSHRAVRAHRRAGGDAAHERRGRARRRLRGRRADVRRVLPGRVRDRERDRPRPRVRAVRRRPVVRDVDAGSRRGRGVRGRDPRASSRASSSPTTARRRSTGSGTWTTRPSPSSSSGSRRWATGSSSSRSPGFHALNAGMFELAGGYAAEGMTAYVRLQEREFELEEDGYTATRHQREVGAGYFDLVAQAVSGGESSTLALKGSTEEAQFEQAHA